MKILFFGSDLFAKPALEALLHSKHQVLATITQADKPAGRGQKKSACPIAEFAKEKNLNLFQPSKIDEATIQKLLNLKPDALVVVAYGKFLPASLIEAIPHQAVNIHPSKLPKYRGAAPMQWALLNGERKTGVTTLKVSQEMDAGDVYLQKETSIGDQEDFHALSERLSKMGANLLLETLQKMEAKELLAVPQDKSEVTFAPKLTKEDGHLQWSEKATSLYNKIRALNPWPGTFCRLGNKILKIFSAEIKPQTLHRVPGTICNIDASITVACGQDSLCLLEVQLEGKKRMSAAEFLKGHPLLVGDILE